MEKTHTNTKTEIYGRGYLLLTHCRIPSLLMAPIMNLVCMRGLESPSFATEMTRKRGSVYYTKGMRSRHVIRKRQEAQVYSDTHCTARCKDTHNRPGGGWFSRARNPMCDVRCAAADDGLFLLPFLAIGRGRTVRFFLGFFSAGRRKEPRRIARRACRFLSPRRRSLVRFPRSTWPTFTRLPSPLCSLHTSRSCNLRLTERKPKGSDRVVTRSVHIGSLNEETRRRRNRLLSLYTTRLYLSVFVRLNPVVFRGGIYSSLIPRDVGFPES